MDIHSPEKMSAALNLFDDLISDLTNRAEAFRTDMDVLDDELLELFLTEIRRVVDGLFKTIPDQDEHAIREYAHSLLGMGGVAGSPEISVVGEEVSKAAKMQEWERCTILTQTLDKWLHSQKNETPPPSLDSNLPTLSLSGLVLIVDDELANRTYLEKLLTGCGARTLLAEDGEIALEMIRKHRPDLALVDVVMPGIQGYEVCETITNRPDLNQTSVIMVTAKSSVEDVELAFSKGAFDYIRKPFQSRELLARVSNALELKRKTDALRLWKARMSRELEMAGAVQSKLFDATPEFGSHYDYQVCYQPSQHIGGDMFDLIHLPSGKLLAYIADVAGHGVGSALISTLIKGMIQDIVSGLERVELHAIGNELHRRFRKSVEDPELYATMILLEVDPLSRESQCLSCGHHLPFVFDEHGTLLENLLTDKGGMPIGFNPLGLEDPYLSDDVIEFTLPSSGLIYIYTDGIIEALTSEGVECEKSGLLRAMNHCHREITQSHRPKEILRILSDEGVILNVDDCTLMCLKMLTAPSLVTTGTCNATLEQIIDVATEVSEQLVPFGWDDSSIGLVQLLIIEHGSNVIKHGNPPPDSEIFYRLSLCDDQAIVVLKDQAFARRPSHWEESPQENAEDPLNEHGRGLHLIQTITNRQEYYRRNQRNCFVYQLHKNVGLQLQER